MYGDHIFDIWPQDAVKLRETEPEPTRSGVELEKENSEERVAAARVDVETRELMSNVSMSLTLFLLLLSGLELSGVLIAVGFGMARNMTVKVIVVWRCLVPHSFAAF